ncbi:MAG: hypothetical protein ACFFD4_01255 [Candidatus Odinarchaeota archaeon]
MRSRGFLAGPTALTAFKKYLLATAKTRSSNENPKDYNELIL